MKIAANGFIHMSGLTGHRSDYQRVLVRCFGLQASSGRVFWRPFLSLLRAKRVLFGSIDDDYFGFFSIALIRSIIGKKTVGIFIRPQTCFGKISLKRFLKRWIFKSFKLLNSSTVITIVPFSISPEYEQIADWGGVDPQFWDLEFSKDRDSCATLLSEIRLRAAGRKVLSFIGVASQEKGIDHLVSLVLSNQWPCEKFMVVIAGKPNALNHEVRLNLESKGVFLIPKFLDDSELLAIYEASDLIWTCYHPDYDQASGIFGRALQFGRPTIVRKGSILEVMAKSYNARSLALDIDDRVAAYSQLESFEPSLEILGNEGERQSSEWREEFCEQVWHAL